MSLLYSILKPIVRMAVKGSSLHREESYEAFKRESYRVQAKFKFSLPRIRGYEFRDEPLDGFHIIVGKKEGRDGEREIIEDIRDYFCVFGDSCGEGQGKNT